MAAAYNAAVIPGGPAPTMMTSYSKSFDKGDGSLEMELGDGRWEMNPYTSPPP
jgi:hypothetical protein